jgi:Ca2+-binding RTX toxin-like protein
VGSVALVLAGVGVAVAAPTDFGREGLVQARLVNLGPDDNLVSADCPASEGRTVVKDGATVPGAFGTGSWAETSDCRASWAGGADRGDTLGRLSYTESWTGERLRKVVVTARANADIRSAARRVDPTTSARYELTFRPTEETLITLQAEWKVRERLGKVKAGFDYRVSCAGGAVGATGRLRTGSGSWRGRLVLPDPSGPCTLEVAARTVLAAPGKAPTRNRVRGTLVVTATVRGCQVVGTDGPDVLIGTGAGQLMCGRGGNDTIRGKGGDDVILGGPGNDRLYGDAGADLIYGQGGDDRAEGGGGRDRLFLGSGTDRGSGGRGGDLIDGGSDDDRLRGDGGDDTILGGDGDDLLAGGAGSDRIDGGDDVDDLAGGPGNDTLLGGNGADLLCGDQGNDRLLGELGSDAIGGGGGRDRIIGAEGFDILAGDTSPTSCRRSGPDGPDRIDGGGGDDEIIGGGGGDRLKGGPGRDRINGGPGADRLTIKDGERDKAIGGPGRDRLVGGRDPQDQVSSVP